ncbi:MAG: magnesium transporter, partial [Acholeplasmataceae bacterium]
MQNILLNKEELFEAVSKKDVKTIRLIFEEHNPVDIADALSKIERVSDFIFIFKTVPALFTAEVFSYLENKTKEKIINEISNQQISDILENLYTDDIVDFIEEMPSNLIQKILQSATKNTRDDINHLLDYPDNSTGSIMTLEYVELKAKDNALKAMEKVRIQGKDAETISYLFVVNDKRELVGTLHLRDLIFADPKSLVNEIMEKDFISVFTYDDQEVAANIVKKYDLNTIPVTTKDFRLVGIITADDIIDVIEQEASEDMQKMGAMTPLVDPYLQTSVFNLAKKRIPWLFILMVSATITSLIINKYEVILQTIPALSMFIPMLMDTSGNAGNQSSVLVIRGLALGEINTKDYLKILRKEFMVALIAGSVLAVSEFIWIIVQIKIGLI